MIQMAFDAGQPDVIVVGGGPAGSTAAAFLAKAGRHVTLVEKEANSRFHIGESLLPRNLDICERLGVLDQVRAIGVHKPGAEFASDRTGRSSAFPFANALNWDRTHAWQVRRAELDALLFTNAIKHGAAAFQETRVTDVQPGAPDQRSVGDGPRMASALRSRCLRPRHLHGFADEREGLQQVYRRHVRALRRGDPSRWRTCRIFSIHLAEDGWFWLIPLPDDIMSIGLVGNRTAWKGRTGTPGELFMSRIASSPTVSARTRGAKLVSDVYSTANYSYRARQVMATASS